MEAGWRKIFLRRSVRYTLFKFHHIEIFSHGLQPEYTA